MCCFFSASLPKRVQHGSEQTQALPAHIRRVREMAFLFEDMLLQRGPTGAAVLDWPVRCSPAFLEQNAIPALQVFFRRRRETVISARRHVGREVLAQEGPHFLSKGCHRRRSIPVSLRTGVPARRSVRSATSAGARPSRRAPASRESGSSDDCCPAGYSAHSIISFSCGKAGGHDALPTAASTYT